MRLKVIDSNERVYEHASGIPTIELGDGRTIISEMNIDHGFGGICFSEDGIRYREAALKGTKTEEGHTTYEPGRITATTLDAYLLLLTDSPESLGVLIKMLECAKASLEREQNVEVKGNALMRYDPATGEPNPYPSLAKQYRAYHGTSAWIFNPYTGAARNALDIGSDSFGHLIQAD